MMVRQNETFHGVVHRLFCGDFSQISRQTPLDRFSFHLFSGFKSI